MIMMLDSVVSSSVRSLLWSVAGEEEEEGREGLEKGEDLSSLKRPPTDLHHGLA